MTLILALLASSLSFASIPVDAIKLADGKVAHCAVETDLGTLGYRPALPLVTEVNGELQLSFSVLGLICSRVDGALVWSPRPLNESFVSRALDDEPVQFFILSNEAVVADRNYTKILGAQALENSVMQTVTVELKRDELLSPTQRDALERGRSVSLSLRYFNRSKNEYSYRGRFQKGRMLIGGAYNFAFDLVKDNGALKASAVTIF